MSNETHSVVLLDRPRGLQMLSLLHLALAVFPPGSGYWLPRSPSNPSAQRVSLGRRSCFLRSHSLIRKEIDRSDGQRLESECCIASQIP